MCSSQVTCSLNRLKTWGHCICFCDPSLYRQNIYKFQLSCQIMAKILFILAIVAKRVRWPPFFKSFSSFLGNQLQLCQIWKVCWFFVAQHGAFPLCGLGLSGQFWVFLWTAWAQNLPPSVSAKQLSCLFVVWCAIWCTRNDLIHIFGLLIIPEAHRHFKYPEVWKKNKTLRGKVVALLANLLS